MNQKVVLPIIEQLKDYKPSDFKKDFYAALMVALLLIPQGMAYALLAGLPPVYGLYSAVFPAVIYGVFGSASQLSVGPVAVVSIMVFYGIAPLAEPGTVLFLTLVVFLSLLVGLMQMFMAVLRVGTLMQFVPQSVIRGFTSALALTIILNQIGQLVDITFARESPFLFAAIDLIKNLHGVQSSVLGFSFFLLLVYFFSKYNKVFPPILIFVIISTLIVAFFPMDNIKTVGEIPSGLPSFSIPIFITNEWTNLLPLAFFIALISFLESFAMATILSEKTGRAIEPNHELFALGFANVIGSFFSSFPVAGAFSRSAVSAQAGARSGLSSVITAGIVILALCYLTEAFLYLPLSALAIIIIFAAKNLVDLPSLSFQYKNVTMYNLIVFITFFSSLYYGLKQGFLFGVIASLLSIFLMKSKKIFGQSLNGRRP